ncbi:MAG: DNA gyrase subunit A, partial [Bacillaceae bacterium]|nr:DNA gyrase subunit A [Bacillaceae bacterium]
EKYRLQGRGGKGIKTYNIVEKTGPVVAMMAVKEDEDVMVITNCGILIRMAVSDISQTGRIASGVKLINLEENDYVSALAKVEKEEETESE